MNTEYAAIIKQDGGLHWGPYARTGDYEGMPAGVTDAQLTPPVPTARM